jgi:hypothetical protein
MTATIYTMIETTKEYQQVVKDFNLSPPKWWDKTRLKGEKAWNYPKHIGKLHDLINSRRYFLLTAHQKAYGTITD